MDGQLCPTFKQACSARGLLEDDAEWIACFNEASLWSVGSGLRPLFVSALVFGNLLDPAALWMRFRTNICDDLERRIDQHVAGVTIPADFPNAHLDFGLFLIREDLCQYERTLAEYGMPESQLRWQEPVQNQLVAAQRNFNLAEQQAQLDVQLPQLNSGQRAAYDTIMHAINTDPEHAHFFVQGPGGTGKTFLYTAICRSMRARGDIVLCVASSGIAAQLLPGGTTAHSRFKIPLQCFDGTTCNVTRQSNTAELLRQTRLIIWDEAPMQNKTNVVAVHRTLSDVRSSMNLFGGVPVLFGGDFAQILPVVLQGTRATIVGACLQRTEFWPRLQCLHLTQNMRLAAGGENAAYARWIADVPYNPAMTPSVPIFPGITRLFTDESAFYDHVFPPDALRNAVLVVPSNANPPPNFFRGRAILACRNDDVSATNRSILAKMPGEPVVLDAVDSTDANDAEAIHELTVEFLAELNPACLPPSRLVLKVGAPVMLLRNLHPHLGLCNGTRAVVLRIHRSCLQIRITGGEHDGAIHHLFRAKLTTNEGDLPWIITRKQFPIRLCFAITINKAQGQSLSTVGVDLRQQCFTHGQLYVALSRVTNVSQLSLLLSPGVTTLHNVVYPEVLLRPPGRTT